MNRITSPESSNLNPGIANGEARKALASAAIEQALSIYRQMQDYEPDVLLYARTVVAEQIDTLIDGGESDQQRLVVGALIHLKALDREREANESAEMGGLKMDSLAG